MQTSRHEPTPRRDNPQSDAPVAVDDDKARKARKSRRVLNAVAVLSFIAIGVLVAVFALRPDTEALETADTLPTGETVRAPAKASETGGETVVLTHHVFPATKDFQRIGEENEQRAGREAKLEGMMVTETVGDRFVYIRPATRPNTLPLLVDISDARELELDPAKVVTVAGVLRPADDAGELDALSEQQRERLKVARVYLDAEEIVAPPES